MSQDAESAAILGERLRLISVYLNRSGCSSTTFCFHADVCRVLK